MDDNDMLKNNYTKMTIKLVLFSILRCDLFKFITETFYIAVSSLKLLYINFVTVSVHISLKCLTPCGFQGLE